MAKGLVYLDGLDDVIADFDRVVGDIEKESVKALEESLSIVESQMKSNARAVFTDGYTQGVMINSISHNIRVKDERITATVGVYDMSRKTGSTERRIPEPIIAYWYEFGIQPHSTTAKAVAPKGKRKGSRQSKQIHPGSAPRPFLSTAFDSNAENILQSITDRLNKSIDKK